MDYSKEQVITDILDQYERHLNFIHLHREAPGNSVTFPECRLSKRFLKKGLQLVKYTVNCAGKRMMAAGA
jgi:hypothetical protein